MPLRAQYITDVGINHDTYPHYAVMRVVSRRISRDKKVPPDVAVRPAEEGAEVGVAVIPTDHEFVLAQ